MEQEVAVVRRKRKVNEEEDRDMRVSQLPHFAVGGGAGHEADSVIGPSV